MDVWIWQGMYGSGQPAIMKAIARYCVGAAGRILLSMSARRIAPPTIQTTVMIPMAFGVWLASFRETELAVPRKTASPSQCMGAPSCARFSHPVYLSQEDDITFRRPPFLGQGSQFALGTGLSGTWSQLPTLAVAMGGASRFR